MSEFYSCLSLESVGASTEPLSLSQLLTGTVDFSDDHPNSDAVDNSETCDVGFVEVFGDGFALVSKVSGEELEKRREIFAQMIQRLPRDEARDPNSFKIGN